MSEPRTWTEADPAPSDWPTVVDEDGVTWKAVDEDGLGCLTYHQQRIVHLASGGATAGILAGDFSEIFDFLPDGAMLREATPEEADMWCETWEASSV